MKRILCLWFPNWPLQRLLIARPELRSQPLVLYGSSGRGVRTVVACSRAARQWGIRPGMPLAEATSLGQQRPLHCQVSDPVADQEALEQLAETCHGYSPLVGLEDAPQPEALLLDVTGLATLFGGEPTLICRVAIDLQRQGYAVRAALADTIGAAWAVAHYGLPSPPPAPPGQSQASSAAGLQGPMASALIVVPAGRSLDALRPLPVEALRPPGESLGRLHQLAIERIEQLLVLPRAEIGPRLGVKLLERLDQALGTAGELIVARRPASPLAAQWSLEFPTERRAAIEGILEGLIQRLAVELAQRGQGALQLVCRIDCQSAPDASWTVGLFQPSALAQHLFELACMQLQRMRLKGPATAVRVAVAASAPLVDRQKRLFADDPMASPRSAPRGRDGQASPEMAALIDRLTARLGRQAVRRVQRVADAQPERAYCDTPWLGRSAARGRQQPTSPPSTQPLERPLCLVSPPHPLEVTSVVPDGPPIRFRLSGRLHQVARHWGPERIETGWWRQSAVRRDYYRIETTEGARFWLFRRLEDAAWFLHGEFA